jgi:hypothetical protein
MCVTDLNGTLLDVTQYRKLATTWEITLASAYSNKVVVYANTNTPGIMFNKTDPGISETYRVETLTGEYQLYMGTDRLVFLADAPGLDMPGTTNLYGSYLPKMYLDGAFRSFVIQHKAIGFSYLTTQLPVLEPVTGGDETSLNGLYGVQQLVALEHTNPSYSFSFTLGTFWDVPFLEKYPLSTSNYPAVFSMVDLYQGFYPNINENDYQTVKCRLETLASAKSYQSEAFIDPSDSYPPDRFSISKFLDTDLSTYTGVIFPIDPFDLVPIGDKLMTGSISALYPDDILNFSNEFGRKTNKFYAVPFKEGFLVNLLSDKTTNKKYGAYIFGCLIGEANGGSIGYWIAPNFVGSSDDGRLWFNFINQVKQSNIVEFDPDPDNIIFSVNPWLEPRSFLLYGRPLEKRQDRIILS